MILDLDDIQEKDSAKCNGSCSSCAPSCTDIPSPASQDRSSPGLKGQVIMRVLHTRTELNIYPDGKTFIRNSQSWFEDKFYTPPAKKEKPKAKEIKTVEVKKQEDY